MDNFDYHSLLAGLPTPALAALGGLATHAVAHRREPTLAAFGWVCLIAFIAICGFEGWHSSGSVRLCTVLLAWLSWVVSLGASIGFYRVLWPWHPLYSIPGPLLARVSQLWIFGRVLHGQTRHDLQRLHVKYGDVVRIGPNEVSVSYAGAITQIHGAKSWIKGKSYGQTASGMADSKETSLISLRTHQSHGVRRKLWDKAFSIASLRDYQGVIQERMAELDQQLVAHCGQAIDLHHWIGLFVWDVMTDLAYGGGGNMINSGTDINGQIDGLCQSLHVAGIKKVMPWITPVIECLPMSRSIDSFRSGATQLFHNRLQRGRGPGVKDVFFHLLGEGGEDGSKLSTNELAADSALVIAAGADTTRLVLATLFMFMLRTPHLYTELQQALDLALAGEEVVPSHEALANIPLLDAYLNETLRVNPPVPFANQREAPAGGAQLQNYHVPEGTQVRVACYAIHHDIRNFSSPDSFDPQRWINQDRYPTFNRASFFPFLLGSYHCPGKLFAFQEMRSLVATIVSNFDIISASGFDSLAFEKSFEDRGLIEIHKPLSVVMTRRKVLVV